VLDPGPHSWPCDLAGVATVFNRIGSPSRSLTCGLDFTVAGGRITFRDDPFADPLLAARDVVDADGRPVDREVALWCFAADSDRGFIHEHFGHVLGIRLESSAAYRDLVNAVFDAFVGGTAVEQLLAALAAIAGTPLVREAEEVVEGIYSDGRGFVVATDRNAYRFPAGAVPVVTPGQVVRAGDPLVDTLEVRELNDGVVPPGLASFSIGEGILAHGYHADVAFHDRDVPVAVVEGPGRFTRVSWELGGHPADVERFWDEVHARGIARGQTLAHALDLRDDPATEPGRDNLPDTVNPLAFLLRNLLRGNAIFVRIRAGGLGEDALGLEHLRLLRRVVPPHACLITLIDLPPVDDSVTMGRVDEELDAFDAGVPLDDDVDHSTLQFGPAEVANIRETCR
jgi:hypothetical protein